MHVTPPALVVCFSWRRPHVKSNTRNRFVDHAPQRCVIQPFSCANAGMAVAVAGRALGIHATIVASEVDHECRLLDEFKRLGAKVVLHGSEWNSADAHARELGEKDGCAYVEMFDHPLIFDGHASLVHELYADRKGVPPSCIVLSVGGGGLLSGVCTGLKQVGWTSVPVFACQSERCNLLDAALKAGGTPTPTHIFSADGHDLGTRTVAQQAVDFARECDVRSLLVTDADTLETVARFADDERILVEPLCAVALAALSSSRVARGAVGAAMSKDVCD